MSKRKAAVNDIIYELDNDDIEVSSEDEAKEAKINGLETNITENIVLDTCNNKSEVPKVDFVNFTEEAVNQNTPPTKNDIGGKISVGSIDNTEEATISSCSPRSQETECEVDSNKKLEMDSSKTTIYNEDIIIDSPASNSDLGVVGCENRTPLVTVKFRDRKLAANYKNKLKTFMLKLIKLHEEESLSGLDSETDIELDIWPEDLNDDEEFEDEAEASQNLFFVDTDPCSNRPFEVPTYKNVSTLISNHQEREPSPPAVRRGPSCFNCDGAHQLRDCQLPKNSYRIAEKRKQVMATRVGRYHVEDEQKYGHLIPGRISGQLRHALGLKRHELPLHIYRMRMLGYPPGWLEEARISHSGITMFDSSGAAILDPEEEEGEVSEPGSKDKFDIKKILDFPGFNVPASSRYKEEGHMLGIPPMSEQDSKIVMLQMLAPNAMKAYKRKKLTLFPSASNNVSTNEVAEMDLDSGDETADFPSVPPLPDDAPPPPPPPPPKTPSPEPVPPGTSLPSSPAQPPGPTLIPAVAPPSPPPEPGQAKADEKFADDVQVLEVIQVKDIPVPETLPITIDDDDSVEIKSEERNGSRSPSLDDLEMKKKLLLEALEGNNGEESSLNISSIEPDNENVDNNKSIEENKLQEAIVASELDNEGNTDIQMDTETNDKEIAIKQIPDVETSTPNKEAARIDKEIKTQMEASTPEPKAGHVRTTSFGTPVMNVASPYMKLPSDDKFAKDICDVINFENLPNSTGKYKQICHILKRVKTEVDRIQDS